MDTVPISDLNDYPKVRAIILQTLNLCPEVHSRRLQEIDFGPDLHPRLVDQQIRAAGLRWLCPEAQTKERIVESALVEHYVAILPFKQKNWVLCHQPATLEEGVTLMEVNASAEGGLYLILKRWKSKVEAKGPGMGINPGMTGRRPQEKHRPGTAMQEREGERGEEEAVPPLSMHRPHTRSLTSKSFMCGKPSHFQ